MLFFCYNTVMNEVFRWFRYFPILAGIVLGLAFVWPCVRRVWARILWAAGLAASLLMFQGYEWFGGSIFRPELPEKLLWLWSVTYWGALMLTALAPISLWWRSKEKVWTLPLVACAISACGLWNALSVPGVTEIELRFPDLPTALDGYRIAQISDLHASGVARRWRTEAIVDKANALSPDVICLTGDIADGSVAERLADVEPLRRLVSRDGVYAVSGNHEFFYDFESWKLAYAGLGVHVLENACVFPRAGLALGGVNDFSFKGSAFAAPDVRAAFESATNGEFRVLMQHRPHPTACAGTAVQVDLQLSGHTHGGFMPLLKGLTADVNGGFLTGVHSVGKGRLVVSSGCGPWPAFPFRYLTPSEIVLVVLRRGE